MKEKLTFYLKELFCILVIRLESFVGLKPPMVSILGYHSISSDNTVVDVSRSNFIYQINYLKEKFQIVSLDEVIDHIKGKVILTKPSIALTFDDGYRNILDTVAPILKKHNVPATLFVLSHPKHVNRRELDNSKKLLTNSEIKKLQKSGWIIGGHSATHANLLKLENSELKKEIENSKKTLEKNLQTPISYFAYPKGFYNKKVVDFVRKSRYKAAFTMDEQLINEDTHLYKMPRLGVDRTRTKIQFMALFTHSIIFYFTYKYYFLKSFNTIYSEISQFVNFMFSFLKQIFYNRFQILK